MGHQDSTGTPRPRPRRHRRDARVNELGWRLAGLTVSAAATEAFSSMILRTLAQGLVITWVTLAPEPGGTGARAEREHHRDGQDGHALPASDPACAAVPPWGTPPPTPTGARSAHRLRSCLVGPDTRSAATGPERPECYTVYAVFTCVGRVHVTAYEVRTVRTG